jgi:hypothetical protein
MHAGKIVVRKCKTTAAFRYDSFFAERIPVASETANLHSHAQIGLSTNDVET